MLMGKTWFEFELIKNIYHLRLFYWFGYSPSIFIENQRIVLTIKENDTKLNWNEYTFKIRRWSKSSLSWSYKEIIFTLMKCTYSKSGNKHWTVSFLFISKFSAGQKNIHSKPWLTFKASLYLSFGSVGSCSFSHLMISLQIIFQKCTMKCRKSHVFLLSSLWT